MKREIIVFIIAAFSLSVMAACSGKKEDPGEAVSPTVQEEPEKPERLNMTKFENLSAAAEQAGYSFRALKEFSNGYKFGSFSISEDVQEVNGMKLEEPSSVIKLQYQKKVEGMSNGMKMDITIFPYEGEQVQSAARKPVCYVSTGKVNGIDVHLSEYILYIVPPDYEMTEEDWEFNDSGKGSFSSDGSDHYETDYFPSMYWVQDGIYYELDPHMFNVPVEEIEELVSEIMNAQLH